MFGTQAVQLVLVRSDHEPVPRRDPLLELLDGGLFELLDQAALDADQVVVVLVLVGAVAVVASPLFDVRTVDVQGAVYTDPDVLQHLFNHRAYASAEVPPITIAR